MTTNQGEGDKIDSITVERAANILGVSKRTVHGLVHSGTLRKIGDTSQRGWLISLAEVRKISNAKRVRGR